MARLSLCIVEMPNSLNNVFCWAACTSNTQLPMNNMLSKAKEDQKKVNWMMVSHGWSVFFVMFSPLNGGFLCPGMLTILMFWWIILQFAPQEKRQECWNIQMVHIYSHVSMNYWLWILEENKVITRISNILYDSALLFISKWLFKLTK